MSKIIQFPTAKIRTAPLSQAEYLSQEITAEEAVNELTHCMLTEVIKLYIENKWSFSDLDYIVAEFRQTMVENAPEHITRRHVQIINDRLKDTWIHIVDSIRSSRI